MTKKQLNQKIKNVKFLAEEIKSRAHEIWRMTLYLDRALTDRKTRLSKNPK